MINSSAAVASFCNVALISLLDIAHPLHQALELADGRKRETV
jgi:hypothetical protein